MPRHLTHICHAASIVVLTGAIYVGAVAGSAQGTASPFDGRWVVAANPWFDRLATAAGQGRGGAGGRGGRGDQAPARDVVIELKVAPNGGVSGRATGTSGRRGSPGSHPAHDVEITRGTVTGETLTFQIWQFDGFHNRIHATARASDDGLELEFRRETPAGPDAFTTRARRATY